MSGDVFHIPALGEQSVNFTKIGIINNLRYSSSCYSGCFRDLLLRPSKVAQTKDNGVSACFLPGTDVRNSKTWQSLFERQRIEITASWFILSNTIFPCISLLSFLHDPLVKFLVVQGAIFISSTGCLCLLRFSALFSDFYFQPKYLNTVA